VLFINEPTQETLVVKKIRRKLMICVLCIQKVGFDVSKLYCCVVIH